jgi:cyclophilin family peptidyl-prolyl cis-trans isomerase
MKKIILILGVIACLLVAGCAPGETKMNNQVEIVTNKGTIVVELNPEAAPNTVANFYSYIDASFYDGTIFHRVMPGFMIQGGGFTVDGTEKETRDPIAIESDNGLKNVKGSIAMARTMDPNSATSQFFINTVDNAFLDRGFRDEGYTVFGRVVEGMDVVETIEQVRTAQSPMPDWPVQPVIIETIRRK